MEGSRLPSPSVVCVRSMEAEARPLIFKFIFSFHFHFQTLGPWAPVQCAGHCAHVVHFASPICTSTPLGTARRREVDRSECWRYRASSRAKVRECPLPPLPTPYAPPSQKTYPTRVLTVIIIPATQYAGRCITYINCVGVDNRARSPLPVAVLHRASRTDAARRESDTFFYSLFRSLSSPSRRVSKRSQRLAASATFVPPSLLG